MGSESVWEFPMMSAYSCLLLFAVTLFHNVSSMSVATTRVGKHRKQLGQRIPRDFSAKN